MLQCGQPFVLTVHLGRQPSCSACLRVRSFSCTHMYMRMRMRVRVQDRFVRVHTPMRFHIVYVCVHVHACVHECMWAYSHPFPPSCVTRTRSLRFRPSFDPVPAKSALISCACLHACVYACAQVCGSVRARGCECVHGCTGACARACTGTQVRVDGCNGAWGYGCVGAWIVDGLVGGCMRMCVITTLYADCAKLSGRLVHGAVAPCT